MKAFLPFPLPCTAAAVVLLLAAPAPEALAQDGKPEKPPASPEEALPRPLRRYDENRDGKLTGEEITMARQAHNRGGRRAEPNEGAWNEMLNRLKTDWRRRRLAELDLNDDGELNDAEKKRADELWGEMVAAITAVRYEMIRKHDKNDDGELTSEERQVSRRETETRRREEEDAIMEEAQARAEKAAAEANR